MYKNLFEGGLNFTYSQEDLVEYYKNYQELMNFWKLNFCGVVVGGWVGCSPPPFPPVGGPVTARRTLCHKGLSHTLQGALPPWAIFNKGTLRYQKVP